MVSRVARFADREHAGEELGRLLVERGVAADVVLAVPRGGLPVGRAVADALSVPLDVVVARKVGAPGNPELAVGAVGADGTVWLNESLLADLDVGGPALDAMVERERVAAAEKAARYRGDRPALDLAGETVLVVDDGVATGATTVACLRQVRAAGAERVVLAVPVAPPSTVERLRDETDEVVAIETPPQFRAVGQFYDDFTQVEDEEARRYLSSP